MRYSLVESYHHYKGIGRSFIQDAYFDQFRGDKREFRRRRRKEFKQVLQYWFDSIELADLQPVSAGNFQKLCDLCREMQEYGIECEVIVYDYLPLEDAYEKAIEFLGIDIETDGDFPLGLDKNREDVKQFLNDNGLCPDIETAEKLTSKWMPEFAPFAYVYVYRVGV